MLSPEELRLTTIDPPRAALIGDGGVVVQLRDTMNTVCRSKPRRRRIWRFVRTYILSLAGVLAVGFLLLV